MAISPAKKLRIFQRDGFKCTKCGGVGNLTIDHVVPWSAGGRDDEANLKTMCNKCNSEKSNHREGSERTFLERIFKSFFLLRDAKILREDVNYQIGTVKSQTLQEVEVRINSIKPALKQHISDIYHGSTNFQLDNKIGKLDLDLTKKNLDTLARIEALERHLKIKMVQGDYQKIKTIKQ